MAALENLTGPAPSGPQGRPSEKPEVKLPRVFLAYGEESYYQLRLVRAVRRLTVDPALEAFNYTFLEHEAAAWAAVQGAVLTLPMMADRRLVVVRDPAELMPARTAAGKREEDAARETESAEGPEAPEAAGSEAAVPGAAAPTQSAPAVRSTAAGEAAERWAALLGEVPAETRLVITLSWELPESSPLLKAAARLGDRVDVVRCLPATPKSAETWVMKMVAERGGVIDPEAAQALVLRAGSDLTVLENEVAKLLTYVGAPSGPDGREPARVIEPARVTVRDVLEVATPSAEASVFEMVDHLGNRRPYQAVTKLRRLLEQGEAPLGLFAMVVRQVRLVLLAREMLASGSPVRDIEKRMGLPTFVVRRYLAQARNFDTPRLVGMLKDLGRLDLDIKTGRRDPGEALELFLLRQG